MSRRKRAARLRITGDVVHLNAPGLKQVKRKTGLQLYWVKDEGALYADYKPATVRIHVDLSDPTATDEIVRICRREQDCMVRCMEEQGDDKERLGRSSTARSEASA